MRWSAPLTDCTEARLPAGTAKKACRTPQAESKAASRTEAATAYLPTRRGSAFACGLAARHGRIESRRPTGSRKAARQVTHSRKWSSTSRARAAASSPGDARGEAPPRRRTRGWLRSRGPVRAARANPTRAPRRTPRHLWAPRRRARPRWPRAACRSSWLALPHGIELRWSLRRARCSVTATLTRDTPSARAISLLSRPSRWWSAKTSAALGGSPATACLSHARSSATSWTWSGRSAGLSGAPSACSARRSSALSARAAGRGRR